MNSKGDGLHGALPLQRRGLLRVALAAAVSGPVAGCVTWPGGGIARDPSYRRWPRYVLRREVDDLYLELIAIGYEETRFLSQRCIRKVKGRTDHRLVFSLPPQHYAERAIANDGKPLLVIPEAVLSDIDLMPSAGSEIVLVDSRDRVHLQLKDLLDWSAARMVLPDLSASAPRYELTVPRPFGEVTRIEIPWGLELTPLKRSDANLASADLQWETNVIPRSHDGWTEIWTASLSDEATGRTSASFEVFSARNFKREGQTGSVADGSLVVSYSDVPGTTLPDANGRVTAIRSLDRLDITTSLSRRFPYTGKPGVAPVESALIHYKSQATRTDTCSAACYADGRSISVTQFQVSARGGWLELDSTWKPFPGCALTGWTHSASLGRDHKVEIVDAGFLFPWGTPAELVTLTERVFLLDESGHFVAPAYKQTFIQIPQPNQIRIDHPESVFESFSITTVRTPPLDLPPAETDPGVYRNYDYFVPTVGSQPFEFEHVGADWSGEKHTSRMPAIFVSNKALAANGLIWERNSGWTYSQGQSPCSPAGGSPRKNQIPKTGDGLRVLDKLWNLEAFRFAKYGSASIAVARGNSKGETAQKVDWVEWVRGPVPKLTAEGIAPLPFVPRARTLKFQTPSMSQLGGEAKWIIGTFRNTRTTSCPFLDPEPTSPDDLYTANIPLRTGVATAPYLYSLEARDLITVPGSAVPETPAAKASRIRRLYFGMAGFNKLPVDLFLNVDNEVQFGTTTSSEGTGGLSVPDTHIGSITRGFGPVGDAAFNVGRWEGYDQKKKNSLLSAGRRLDYAAYRAAHRSQIDIEPFDDSSNVQDLRRATDAADSLMGFPTQTSVAIASVRTRSATSFAKLGEMFGADAQLLPGLTFAKLLENILVDDAPEEGPDTPRLAQRRATATPMKWSYQVVGLESLMRAIGSAPQQISPKQLIEAAKGAQNEQVSIPLKVGLEAKLDWVNTAFEEVDLGAVKFTPGPNATLTLNARAAMDFGADGLPLELSNIKLDPSRATLSSMARMEDFSVLVFKAIEISFRRVSFEMSADGRKQFDTDIADVQLTGSLAFINQLSNILGGLGNQYGIETKISPANVKISQTLHFPPGGGQPLFIGPAMVTNLSLSWGLMIPLSGRDVLSASFALSSREQPLTIYVPPWYGGRAYLYMEVTTRGMRMLEFSMEYGAYVPIEWSIAKGHAGLMAGIYYSVQYSPSGGIVVLRAFVKAFANLSVAGLIHFCGLILITLEKEEGSGNSLVGTTTVRVSIKIAFVRYSYSFSATQREKQSGGGQSMLASAGLSRAEEMEQAPSHAPFDGSFSADRFDAFRRVVAGYV